MQQAKKIYFLIAVIITLSIFIKSVSYLTPDFTKGFLIDKEHIFYFYQYALYIHAFTAVITYVICVIQFLKKKTTSLHIQLGKIYVFLVLFLTAPSACVMAFYAIGGILSTIIFLIMSILWWWFTYQAYQKIIAGNTQAHLHYINRSFILANSAILLRIFAFIKNHYLHLNSIESYQIMVILSWLPWLILYEMSIKKG